MASGYPPAVLGFVTMTGLRISVCGAFCLFALTAPADASRIEIPSEFGRFNLTPFLEVAADDSDAPRTRDLPDAQFVRVGERTINRGLFDGVMWLRFTVRAESEQRAYLELANPRLRDIELYREEQGSLARIASTGTDMTYSRRPLAFRQMVLPLDLGAQEATYYVRIANRGSLRFAVDLWQPERFHAAVARENIALGILYGLLLAMAVYHLCLFASLREPVYIYFVLLAVTYGLFQAALSGLAQQFVWPHATWWADRSILFFNGLAMFFAFAFSSHYLDIERRLPRVLPVFIALMVLSLVVSAGTFLPSLHANLLAHALGIVGPAVLFAAAAYLWWRGLKTAWLFLTGWSAALIGTTLFALMGFGVLAENVVTANGLHAGFAVALLMFSLALAERVKVIEHAHRQRLVALNGQLERRLADCATQIEERGERLRELATRLTKAERDARRQLAQGLHDHLQQLLVATQYRILQVDRPALPKAQRETIEEAERMLRESIAAARDLSMELSPPALHRAGLSAALQWLGHRMNSRHDLDVEIVVEDGARDLTESQSELLFEVARELLFNVVKHSGTRNARVNVTRAGEWLRVTVEDDGIGFDPNVLDEFANPQGFGLAQIKERVAYFGGRINVISGHGRGTRIEVETPRFVAD